MRKRFPGWLALAAACALFRPAAAQAPAPAAPPGSGPVILRVEVLGLKYQQPAEVKALLESREGRRYDKKAVSEDIHRLNRTGRFSHVALRTEELPDGMRLVFTVVENDRIAVVNVAGLKSLTDTRALVDSLRLKAGEYYDPYKVKRDLETLRTTYLEKGYPFVDVTASDPAPGPDGVTLQYTVIEGPEVTVAGVEFTGDVTMDRGALLDKMLTKPPGWPLNLISSTDFVEQFLRDDLDRLRTYYRWEGRLDAEVTLEDVRYSADKTEATPVIRIDEGPAFRVRNVSVQGHTLFSTEEILKALEVLPDVEAVPLTPGGPFSERALKASEDAILEKYHERAYILAEVEVQRLYVEASPEVDLSFQIREHGKIYVDRIVVQGNDKTRDVVIRRALNVGPGEPYNKVALQRGINRLRDLSYFEKVSFREEPGSAPDRRNLVIEVVEAPTGSVRFAGGYSSNFGIVGRIEFTQRNFDIARTPDGLGNLFESDTFAGAGQYFQIEFMPGSRRTGFSVTFREPYVFQEPWGFQARGFRTVVRRIFEYLEDRRGGSLGIDRRFLDETLKVGLTSRFENIDIGDVDLDASTDAREIEGLSQLRTLTPAVSVNTRDSVLNPTEGWSATAGTELAGRFMGGDYDFTKTRLDADYHIPVYTTLRRHRHVLSLGSSFGWMGPNGRDSDVPIFERFFAGGGGAAGLRGFGFRRVGPMENEDPIGGRAILLGQAEYGFPLYEQVLRGAFYLDAGDLEPTLRDIAMDRMRYSTGFGLRFSIPALGGGAPLALYYGIPLRKLPGDRRRSITFDIGFPF